MGYTFGGKTRIEVVEFIVVQCSPSDPPPIDNLPVDLNAKAWFVGES